MAEEARACHHPRRRIDPILRAAGDTTERLQRAGYPAFAGYHSLAESEARAKAAMLARIEAVVTA